MIVWRVKGKLAAMLRWFTAWGAVRITSVIKVTVFQLQFQLKLQVLTF